MLTTGARVRNAYATYPLQGDNGEKFPLIPHIIETPHEVSMKVSMVSDGHA